MSRVRVGGEAPAYGEAGGGGGGSRALALPGPAAAAGGGAALGGGGEAAERLEALRERLRSGLEVHLAASRALEVRRV